MVLDTACSIHHRAFVLGPPDTQTQDSSGYAGQGLPLEDQQIRNSLQQVSMKQPTPGSSPGAYSIQTVLCCPGDSSGVRE